MSAAHTPTPWVLVEKPTTAGTVFKVGSQQMVDGTHGGICLYDDHTSLNPHAPGTQQANAGFIVRACNSHDQLVAALKAALATIEDYVSYEHNGDPWTEDARAMGEMDIDDYSNDGRLEAARAALAAAGAA